MLGFAAFFTTLLVFFDSPFNVTTNPVPSDGAGLEPLLRNPSMLIHPPMLYSGYTFFTIPFAFAVGALVVRRVDADWIRVTRRFALASWMFLGIGVLLGGLSLGNLLGGQLADSAQDRSRAARLFLVSSALVLSVLLMESPPLRLVQLLRVVAGLPLDPSEAAPAPVLAQARWMPVPHAGGILAVVAAVFAIEEGARLRLTAVADDRAIEVTALPEGK